MESFLHLLWKSISRSWPKGCEVVRRPGLDMLPLPIHSAVREAATFEPSVLLKKAPSPPNPRSGCTRIAAVRALNRTASSPE